jgi:hypothetical protein
MDVEGRKTCRRKEAREANDSTTDDTGEERRPQGLFIYGDHGEEYRNVESKIASETATPYPPIGPCQRTGLYPVL